LAEARHKASESPALAKRRAAELERQRKYAKRRGTLEEFDAKIQREEAAQAERERIEATAREQLEAEAEEARIERAKARIRRDAEAVPE
jgi:cell division protein FtsL